MELLVLKKQIKEWEHDFQKKNGRVASKGDIKQVPATYQLYKRYKELRKNKEGDKHIEMGVRGHEDEEASEENIFREASTNSESDGAAGMGNGISAMRFTELGPTPQANGKVLSIFDMKLVSMTPPESSPLKGRGKVGDSLKETGIRNEPDFKTPTKNRIQRLELLKLTPTRQTPSKGSLLDRLNETTTTTSLFETPLYISKHNKNFDFSEIHEESEDFGSPTKRKSINSLPMKLPMKIPNFSIPTTPKQETNTTFQVSPSPLKVHRFLSFGENKMSTLFNDYQLIKKENQINQTETQRTDEGGEANIENGDDFSEESKENPRKRKRVTQKRTTRNWKMKPRVDLSKAVDSLEGKDVHEMVKKLDGDTISDASESEESEYDSDEELLKQKERSLAIIESQKGKIKPLSSNYQRSKINDPRSKAFKRRMRR